MDPRNDEEGYPMRSKIITPVLVLSLALTTASTAAADDAAPATAQASVSLGSGSTSSSASGGGGETDVKRDVLPWVFGGLGAAQIIGGAVMIIAAPEMPANCDSATRTCTRQPGQNNAAFDDDQEKAGQAKLYPQLGGIAIASGTLFLATGIAMHFWYNRSEAKSASAKPVVVPYANANGGGLAAVATF